MPTYTLTQEQLQRIVTYLGSKPANETLKLLNELLSIKPNVESVQKEANGTES